jgi:pentatricopeptide repeat protein
MYAKCGSMWNLSKGRRQENYFNPNVFVGSSLVDMYAKFGSMEDAWRLFNKNVYEQSFEFGIE